MRQKIWIRDQQGQAVRSFRPELLTALMKFNLSPESRLLNPSQPQLTSAQRLARLQRRRLSMGNEFIGRARL
ncbi:MAG: hypothetical protein ACNYNY_01250 [Candidatus Oxydemutatoraceae bacterium WSBS_2016_MAG_OTU14]